MDDVVKIVKSHGMFAYSMTFLYICMFSNIKHSLNITYLLFI